MTTTQHVFTKVIHRQPGGYLGWPTVALLPNGELIAAFSGSRQRHICPFGRTQFIRSDNGGVSWSEVRTVNDSPLDDRDAGLLVTGTGALLLTWFTSDLFSKHFDRYRESYGKALTSSWATRIQAATPEVVQSHLGNWIRRSTDGGGSWSDPTRLQASSPHGPAALTNGTLIHVGWNHGKRHDPLIVEHSTDDGISWQVLSRIALPDDLGPGGYLGEPHVVEAADGVLIAMFRSVTSIPGVSSAPDLPLYLYQSESADAGRTWTTPRRTPIWGYPPHLLKLRDSTLLLSFSHRRDPTGQRACFSTDHGRHWNHETPFCFPPSPNHDHGYPSTVELPEGDFVSVYYQADPPHATTSLFATRWRRS